MLSCGTKPFAAIKEDTLENCCQSNFSPNKCRRGTLSTSILLMSQIILKDFFEAYPSVLQLIKAFLTRTHLIRAGEQHLSQDCISAEWRLRSACASEQTDQSLLSAESALDPWLPTECSEMTDQNPNTRRLIWIFAVRTCNLVGNVVPRLINLILLSIAIKETSHTREYYVDDQADLITKTCLFKYTENFTTKNEHFQIKNSDIFHISAQNIDCEYSLEPPQRGGSNEYPQSMF